MKPARPVWVEWRVPLWLPTESNMVEPVVSSMCQSATRAGGRDAGTTTAVGGEEAVALPPMLLAVTDTSTLLPTSAAVSV